MVALITPPTSDAHHARQGRNRRSPCTRPGGPPSDVRGVAERRGEGVESGDSLDLGWEVCPQGDVPDRDSPCRQGGLQNKRGVQGEGARIPPREASRSSGSRRRSDFKTVSTERRNTDQRWPVALRLDMDVLPGEATIHRFGRTASDGDSNNGQGDATAAAPSLRFLWAWTGASGRSPAVPEMT